MAKQSASKSSSREMGQELKGDLEVLMKDAQALIGSLGDDLDDKAKEAKKRLLETLEESKSRYHVADERLRELGREGVAKTDQIVREYPYHAIGVSFGFGLLVGMLFRNK